MFEDVIKRIHSSTQNLEILDLKQKKNKKIQSFKSMSEVAVKGSETTGGQEQRENLNSRPKQPWRPCLPGGRRPEQLRVRTCVLMKLSCTGDRRLSSLRTLG